MRRLDGLTDEMDINLGKGTRDQMANFHWIIEKAREFQKSIYFCVTEYAKAFDCGPQQTGKFFKRWAYQTIALSVWT